MIDLFAIEGTRDVSNGGCKSVNLTYLFLGSLGGLAAAAAAALAGESLLRRRKKAPNQGDSMVKDQKVIPLIERKDSGRRSSLERFSHYVGTYSYIFDTFQLSRLNFGNAEKKKD